MYGYMEQSNGERKEVRKGRKGGKLEREKDRREFIDFYYAIRYPQNPRYKRNT